MLTVERFTFNAFAENTYLIYNEQKQAIIIDPGCSNTREQEIFKNYISQNGLTVTSIFLTHSHIDHVLGLKFAKAAFNVPVIGHPLADKGLLTTEMVGKLYGIPAETPPPLDQTIEEGEVFKIGDDEFEVLFCPGHSPDHLALFNKQQGFAITGDVIFQDSIGRYDLPGGDYNTLMRSIKEKILILPSDTILYPGHGPETTIKQEISHNPFLK